ncbi:MAG: hypothetical protein DLM73_00075 [Chthoniobacterales bacterium]|nr:MAG: hypothetical protein DLM73_00075 [Chthoniobacterales bacterium]
MMPTNLWLNSSANVGLQANLADKYFFTVYNSFNNTITTLIPTNLQGVINAVNSTLNRLGGTGVASTGGDPLGDGSFYDDNYDDNSEVYDDPAVDTDPGCG